MKYKSLLFTGAIGLWMTLTSTIKDPNNPPVGNTGAPGETTCQRSGCHNGGSFTGTVSISGIPDSVVANQSYTITLTNTSNATRAGFQLVCLDGASAQCGTLTNGTGTSIGTSGGKQYIRQSTPKTLSGGSTSWTFTWKAPASLSNNKITFYFVSLAANGTGNENGDNVLTGSRITKLQTTTSTVDFGQGNLVQIFPNPVSQTLHIAIPEGSKKQSLNLIDIQGRLALERALAPGSNSIDVNHLTKGVYLARINVDGEFTTRKVVIE